MAAPTVKRALVHAASVLTTRDRERVLSVDMRPLVIHLLAGLEHAGVERAVVTLGHDAAQIAECVTAYRFTRLRIDFVYLTIGTVGGVWRNLANSVLAARTAFEGPAPLLIVRADNLYDPRLLRQIATAPFGTSRGLKAFALVDSTPATMQYASMARARHNKYWTRVAFADGDRGRAIRCGTRLGAFDGVVAGEVYASSPVIFDWLATLFRSSLSASLSDAAAALADRGELGRIRIPRTSTRRILWLPQSPTQTARCRPG